MMNMLRRSLFMALALWSGAGFCFAASDSTGVEEVVKLAATGATEDALIAYVRKSNAAYDLSIEQILRLNKMGIPQKVVAAMVQRGKELREQAASNEPAPPLPPAPPVPPAEAPRNVAPVASAPEIGGPELRDRGADTPTALLESMAATLGDTGPIQEYLEFQLPANRASAKAYLAQTQQLGAKVKEVGDLVAARIGRNESGMITSMQSGVHTGCEAMLRYKLAQIAKGGKVDWGKVKITENGNQAQATIHTGEAIQLSRANGKWYLSDEQPLQSFSKDVVGTQELADNLRKVLDLVAQKVNSGQITKANFIQEYQTLINSGLSPAAK
jgi:hypothetical protein